MENFVNGTTTRPKDASSRYSLDFEKISFYLSIVPPRKDCSSSNASNRVASFRQLSITSNRGAASLQHPKRNRFRSRLIVSKGKKDKKSSNGQRKDQRGKGRWRCGHFAANSPNFSSSAVDIIDVG